MDTFAALNVFLTAAERLSFAQAGRHLGLSSSTVGKTIARLEDHLGARLFHRTTRRVSLTAEGELLLDRASRIRDAVDDLTVLLAQAATEPRGRLRISAPSIGYRFLGPHLASFARTYPKVQLDLDFSDGMVDLAADGVDAAIRSGALADSGLMSRRLGDFRFILCAAPSYLTRHGAPMTAAALVEHDLVRYRRPGVEVLQALPLDVPAPPDAMPRPPIITCTNMEAVLAAAVAGLGIACMPDFLAAEALAAGTLVPILSGVGSAGQFRIVWSGSRHVSPKLRAFIDFAARNFFGAAG